jgi:hypothetical protein
VLGQVREDLISVLFLDQGLLDEPLSLREAKLLGPREQGAVAGDLIVLDRLGSRNQPGIQSLAVTKRSAVDASLNRRVAFGAPKRATLVTVLR